METRNEPVFTRVPVAGQSLHRWLVGIPVISYVGTVVFFALYAYSRDLMWLRDGFVTNLVAVIAAMVVAVTGLLDFLQIPKQHRARTVALGHASLMVIVLSFFVANLVVNFRVLSAALKGAMILHRGFDPTMSLALTGFGLGLAVCGGAIGILLAYRFHVGEVPMDTKTPPRAITPRLH